MMDPYHKQSFANLVQSCISHDGLVAKELEPLSQEGITEPMPFSEELLVSVHKNYHMCSLTSIETCTSAAHPTIQNHLFLM